MHNLANSYSAAGRHEEALQLREETLALRKAKLGPDHHETLRSMHNLANSYHALGRYDEALQLREETLALRKAKLGPDHLETLMSMWGLAESLAQADRGAEAVPIIDECVERAAGKVVDAKLIPGVMTVRLQHFEKKQNPAGCRQTAEMWEKLGRTDAESLYTAAQMRAVTAAVVRATDPTPDGTQQADAEADRAMQRLKQAVDAGFNDAALVANDKHLDDLRNREDFQALAARVNGE
jgi:tetratricopeptide (TPR) repeat protein